MSASIIAFFSIGIPALVRQFVVLRVKPLERIIDFMGLNFLDSVIVVVRGARINARISAVIQ